jgi:hypothetical protein
MKFHITLVKNRNMWSSEIKFEGVRYKLGNHKTFEEAVAVRAKKEAELWAAYEQHGTSVGFVSGAMTPWE